MSDGGKWVCGMSLYEALPAEKPCVIYSFGVQTESSFGKFPAWLNDHLKEQSANALITEDEMLARTHCEVWAYNFSVVDFGKQLNASYRDRAHFKPVGIGGDTDLSTDPPFYSIQDLMKQNGHDYMSVHHPCHTTTSKKASKDRQH